MRVAAPIVLTEEQRSELSTLARGRSVALRLVERANIILQAAGEEQDQEIAAALAVGRHTVARWKARFLQYGIRGIEKDGRYCRALFEPATADNRVIRGQKSQIQALDRTQPRLPMK
jgi:hypothetical protein